ncbi:uncharacterized protein [Misgurnus anguillicaudatus]|uniref:uncharacterized protein n=1 Tax=Misgurnus anguillicaudatus TaxID=75329 RepID=UPI003CCFAF55
MVYEKWNSRNFPELIRDGNYITIEELKTIRGLKPETVEYLSHNFDNYPKPVEFHITELTHVTNKSNFEKIWKSGGFKGFTDRNDIPWRHPVEPLSWWSLKINEENIRDAEQRYLEKKFPNRTQEQIAEQQPFLREFTTSPSFKNETSRYGNFRFTIPLTNLMESYKRNVCDGKDPVLRVYQTKIYKQEIVYAVLVHSPQMNEKFQNYPELTSDSQSLVFIQAGQIIWNAQAICETHNNQLILDEGMQKATVTPTQLQERFYVWDHVSLAFHLAEGKVLPFFNPKIDYCKIDELNLSRESNCPYDEALELLKKLCGTQ